MTYCNAHSHLKQIYYNPRSFLIYKYVYNIEKNIVYWYILYVNDKVETSVCFSEQINWVHFGPCCLGGSHVGPNTILTV